MGTCYYMNVSRFISIRDCTMKQHKDLRCESLKFNANRNNVHDLQSNDIFPPISMSVKSGTLFEIGKIQT